MKKLLLATLAMFAITSSAQAAETIKILWGFSASANQVTTLRIMAEEANKIQNDYTFVVEVKPGAGGSIAANSVLADPTNTIISISSSFFIRPAFVSQGSHDLDKFTPVLVQATGTPMAVISKKYKSVKEIQEAGTVTVGISGTGSISHLVGNEIAKSLGVKMVVVNFKSMIEAGVNASGGHIDLSPQFAGDPVSMINAGKVNLIGYTGTRDVLGFKGKTFKDQNVAGVEGLTSNFGIYVSKEMPKDKIAKLNKVLAKVNTHPRVLESYEKDVLVAANIPLEKSQEWYDSERAYWGSRAQSLK